MTIFITDNICESWFINPLGCSVTPEDFDTLDTECFKYVEWEKGSIDVSQEVGVSINLHHQEVVDCLMNYVFEQLISYNVHFDVSKLDDPTFEITEGDKVYFISPETYQVYLIKPNQLPY